MQWKDIVEALVSIEEYDAAKMIILDYEGMCSRDLPIKVGKQLLLSKYKCIHISFYPEKLHYCLEWKQLILQWLELSALTQAFPFC